MNGFGSYFGWPGMRSSRNRISVLLRTAAIPSLVMAMVNKTAVPHDEIDERYTSVLSPMPAALEKTLTDEEFNHLVRFLLGANEPLKPLPDQPTADGGE